MKTKEGTKRRQKAPRTKRPGDARRVLRAFKSLYCTVGRGPILEGNPLPRLYHGGRRERVNHVGACALPVTWRHVRRISGACSGVGVQSAAIGGISGGVIHRTNAIIGVSFGSPEARRFQTILGCHHHMCPNPGFL